MRNECLFFLKASATEITFVPRKKKEKAWECDPSKLKEAQHNRRQIKST